MIKELVKYISNQLGYVIGDDIYAGFVRTDAKDNIVAVLERSGGSVYGDLEDRVDYVVQVYSRNKDYWEGREELIRVYNLLHRIEGVELPVVDGEEYVLMVGEAMAFPQFIGIDDKKRFEFSCNFNLKIRKK